MRAKILDEVQVWRHMDVQDMVVLDGGAHVGYATEIFLEEGAREVIAVEPDPVNCAKWKQRIKDPRAHLLEGALVSSLRGTVPLYVGKGPIASQCHSLVKIDNRPHIEVQTFNFYELASRCDAVKLDIEAGEYALCQDDLPARVTVIGMELHVRRPEWRAQASWVLKGLERQGFRWVVPPPDNHPKSQWGYEVVAWR